MTPHEPTVPLEVQAATAAARVKLRRCTQRSLVLKELQSKVDQWVPMPRLVEVSGAYAVHSRVSDLRKLEGWKIEQRNERREDGVMCSYYRLSSTYVPSPSL